MVEVDSLLRVSAAALCRVIFPHPKTGVMQLALERRTTWKDAAAQVSAQPFGGALRILDPAVFHTAVGDFVYDSVRSSEEQDLRILIPPRAWDIVREFILAQIQLNQPKVIETDPCRELEEEFLESVGITLLPVHYTFRPIGISVQDQPIPTTNKRLPGAATVRIYQIFEVAINDLGIREVILENSQRYTDEEMRYLAKANTVGREKGRANSALVLPLDEVRNAYDGVPQQPKLQPLTFLGFSLEPTTAALFAKGI